jgi:RNA polymerase sigma-70 factor, ECF subfamily
VPDPSALPLEQRPDEALIDAHHGGAAAAFDELGRRYRPRLVMWLTARVGDQHTAEDLAQDALLRAYQGLASFDVSRPLWPWLKAIARNLAIDHIRSAQRRQVPTTDEVAKVIRWVASDEAAYMTGQTLHLNGGMAMI